MSATIRMSSNARQAAAVLAGAPKPFNDQVGLLTNHYTLLLQTTVRAKASGRPGPRRRTGDYRRSITAQTVRQPIPGIWQGWVGTNSPQGRRLENGFVGVDSLGRTYNQKPFPHFAPAVDVVGPQYQGALIELVGLLTSLTNGDKDAAALVNAMRRPPRTKGSS